MTNFYAILEDGNGVRYGVCVAANSMLEALEAIDRIAKLLARVRDIGWTLVEVSRTKRRGVEYS